MNRLLYPLLAIWLMFDWTGLTVPRVGAEPPAEVPVLLEIQDFGGEILSAAVQENILLAGLHERLAVFNLDSPNHPKLIGRSHRLPGRVVGVAAVGGYAYASVEPGQLLIFDISDSRHPTLVNSLAGIPAGTAYPFGHALYIEDQTGWYQANDTILDLTNPTSPSPYPYLSTSQRGMIAFSGSRGFFLDYDKTLWSVDFSDPAAPQEIGHFSTAWEPLSVAAQGNVAAVRSRNGLFMIDFSTPGSPRQLNDGKAHDSDGRWQAASAISGGLLTIASSWDMEVYDITQPTAPRHLSTMALNHISARQLLLSGGKGFLLSGSSGLIVIDMSGLSSPYQLTTVSTYTHQQFDLQNGAGFSTLGDNSLSIARLPDLDQPIWSSTSLVSGQVVWSLSPGLLFIGATTDTPTLLILDLTQPLQPLERSRLALDKPGAPGPISLVTSGNYAYILFANGRLLVVNATNPGAPYITAAINISYSYSTPQISGGILYLWNEPQQQVELYSLADPGQPTWTGSIPIEEPQYGAFDGIITQNRLLLHLNTTLAVYDLSNPAAPQKITQLPLGGYSSNRALWLDGSILYAGRDQTILAIDVSNLEQPRILSHTPGGARRLRMDGGLVYALSANGQITTYRPAAGFVAEITNQQTILLSETDRVEYTFTPGTFTDWSQYAVHIPISPASGMIAVPAGMVPAGPSFSLDAYNSFTEKRISPVKPYRLVISLNEEAVQSVDQQSLALYTWDGDRWQVAPGSTYDSSTLSLSAEPAVTGRFGVFARPSAGSTRSLFLPVVAKTPASPDLSITRLEINQQIQREDNSVPLVAEKPTMLRIHASTSGFTPVDGVTARVSASRNGAALPGSPVLLSPWTVFPAADRASLGSTFNLVLPVEWTREKVDIEVELDPYQSLLEPRKDNNRTAITISFQVVPPMKLVLVPINYTHIPTQAFFPGPTADQSSEGPRVYYPLSAVETTIHAPYVFNGDLSNIKEWLRLLNEITDLRRADGAPATTLYYGVVPDLGTIPPAIGGIGWIGVRASVGFAGVLTHEGGHNLGLGHAPCGVEGDPKYPYPNGVVGQWGLVVPFTTPYPPYAFDFMSYCGGDGFSDYHYTMLFNSLRQVNLGPADTAAAGPALLVRAEFKPDGSAFLLPLYRLPSASLEPDPGERVTIELLDSEGSVVASHPVGILVASEEASTRSVRAAVPLPDRPVSAVRVVKDGTLLAQQSINSLPPGPLPLILQSPGAAGFEMLKWASQKPAVVQVSTDGEKTWQTIAVDVEGGQLKIDSTWFQQQETRFRVFPSW